MILEKQLTWAEIDLNAYAHNIKELRRVTRPGARLMAVVKANGYGHGAVEVARTALQNGAESLGVARLHEAVELREAGLEAPILIFGYSSPDSAETLINYDLTQTVYSPATAEELSDQAARKGKIKIHIKVDSGMGRLGLLLDELAGGISDDRSTANTIDDIAAINGLANLETEGIFTHFATADSADKSYANKQLDRFTDFLNRLNRAGLSPPVRHAANSGAVIDMAHQIKYFPSSFEGVDILLVVVPPVDSDISAQFQFPDGKPCDPAVNDFLAGIPSTINIVVKSHMT